MNLLSRIFTRSRAALGLAGLIAGGLPAAEANELPLYFAKPGPLPPHPTMIITTFEGKAYPIIGVAGENPQIALGDTIKSLHTYNQSFQPLRAAAYAPGSVQISHQTSSVTITAQSFKPAQSGTEQVPVGKTDYDGYYTCTVQAPEDHPDCYVVVLFFCQYADGTPNPKSVALGFGRLGNLKAGQPAVTHINRSYVVGIAGAKYYYFPMVFSRGRELRSNQSSIADQYFHQQEVADHALLVAEYTAKFQGADHPAVPYLQIPLRLPDGVEPQSLPPNLRASFSVDESGGVDSIQLPDRLTPAVRQSLMEEIGEWMFLPRLKQGTPIRTLVTLPLGFN